MNTRITAAPLLALILCLGGCATTDVRHVQYRSTTQVTPAQDERTVALGQFSDTRGIDPQLLCVVKNAYGAILKRIRTDQPVSEVVKASMSEALKSRNVRISDASHVVVQGTVENLGCGYVMNKVLIADIRITVTALPSHTVLFQQIYSTHRTEPGVGAGILANVDSLTELEQETINQTIDKVFADPAFMAALYGADGSPGAAQTAAAAPMNERLKQLDDLHAQGLITDAEYSAKRKELLNNL